MLPTNYDIISVLDDLYRRVSISAVAIVCVCGNPNNEHDLPDIRTFRYQTLSMVHNINKVNRTVRNPFGEDDFYYLGDDYYLDLIQNVFSDFDKVGREFVQAIENTSATSDSFLCERMITTFAYAVRRQSDSSINFGSLSRITADPLPTARSEKLAVIREYFDTTSRALAAFSEFVQLGGLNKINWRRTRFRNLTHYIKEFLVPFFLYQQLSGAHFMRWVTYSWQKAIRPNFPTLQSASLSYDPESFLRMPSYSDQRGYPKNIWCSSQTDQYCGALICNQDTMATGSALRVLQLPAPRPSLDFLQTVRGASHGLTGSDFTLDPQFLELSFPNGLDILASVASSKVLVGKRTVRLEAIEVSDSTESPIPPKQPSNPPKSLKLASRPHPSKQKSRGGHLLCPMSGCPTRVSLAKDMDRHLKSIHGGGKEFYCPLPTCKRSRARRYPFDRLDNWRRHVRIHNMGFTDKDCIIVDMGIL